MKTKITLVAALAFFGFLSLQCKKKNNLDELGLPKATQTGRNIFACRVNGENWISGKGLYNFGTSFRNDTLYIWSLANTDKMALNCPRIALQINKLITAQEYPLNSFAQFALTNKGSCFTDPNYRQTKSEQGTIIITKLDKARKIISGTFSFEIPTEKCGVIPVTDGRFDVTYE